MVISFLLVNIYYFAFFFNICNLLKMLMHFGAATVRIIRNPHFEVYASSVEALSDEGEGVGIYLEWVEMRVELRRVRGRVLKAKTNSTHLIMTR